MPLLKTKYPMPIVLGFERLLSSAALSEMLEFNCKQTWCAFCVKIVSTGVDKSWRGFLLHYVLDISLDTEASCFSFLHQELGPNTSCSPAATPFLSKESNSDGIALNYNYPTLYLVAFGFNQLTWSVFSMPGWILSRLSISKIKTRRKNQHIWEPQKILFVHPW